MTYQNHLPGLTWRGLHWLVLFRCRDRSLTAWVVHSKGNGDLQLHRCWVPFWSDLTSIASFGTKQQMWRVSETLPKLSCDKEWRSLAVVQNQGCVWLGLVRFHFWKRQICSSHFYYEHVRLFKWGSDGWKGIWLFLGCRFDSRRVKWRCVLGNGTSPYLPWGECPCRLLTVSRSG